MNINMKSFLIIFAIIIISIIVTGIYYWQRFSNEKENQTIENIKTEPKKETSESKDQNLPEEFGDWNLYENSKFHFTIRYPKFWQTKEDVVNRSFVTYFYPEGTRKIPGPISIESQTRNCVKNGYEKYLNESIVSIGTSYKLYSKEKITTLSGLEGAKTTWLFQTFGNLGKWEIDDLPVTIFEHCEEAENNSKIILIYIADRNYLDIYEKMVRIFKFE